MHTLHNLPEPDLSWGSVPSVDSSAQTPNEFFTSSNAGSWTDSDNSYFQNDFDSLPSPSQVLSLDAATCLGLTESFTSPLMSDSTYPSLDTSLRQEMIKIYFENVRYTHFAPPSMNKISGGITLFPAKNSSLECPQPSCSTQ